MAGKIAYTNGTKLHPKHGYALTEAENKFYTKESDPVNNPSHYNAHPSGVKCITIVEHFNFCLGNAIKYIWRAGEKDGSTMIQDLKKARWYIDREIKKLNNHE